MYSDPERAFDLYKTLHKEDCGEFSVNDVEMITLENIVLARRYNDVAFRIGSRLIVLVEHQSTINENMPLRMLFYVTAEYEKIISSLKRDLYKSSRVELPKPEFYVVYTGNEEWCVSELKFSDAYNAVLPEDITLELKVKIIKEEDEPGIQTTLGAYYDFMNYLKNKTINGKIDVSFIEMYTDHFHGSQLFKDFLNYLMSEEGIKMINTEYDYETEISVLKEEAIEQGIEQGIKALVLTCRRFNASFSDAIEQVITNFNFTEEEARAKVNKYWK